MNMMDMIDVFEGVLQEGDRPATPMELESLWNQLEEYEDALGEVSAVVHKEMAELEALPMYVDPVIEAHDDLLLFMAEIYDGMEEVRGFLGTHGSRSTISYAMCALLEESLVESMYELHAFLRELYADDMYYGFFLPVFESIGFGEVTVDDCDCDDEELDWAKGPWLDSGCGCAEPHQYKDCHCQDTIDEDACDCDSHEEEDVYACHCDCHTEEEACDCPCHDPYSDEACHCDCEEGYDYDASLVGPEAVQGELDLADPFEEDQVYWTVEGDDFDDEEEDVLAVKEEIRAYYGSLDDDEDEFDDDDFDEEALAKLARLVEEKKRKIERTHKEEKKAKKEKKDKKDKKKKDKKEKKSKEEKALKKAKKLQKKIDKIKALAEEVHGAQARMILASLEEKLGLSELVAAHESGAQERPKKETGGKQLSHFVDTVEDQVEEEVARNHRRFSFSALLEPKEEGEDKE